MHVSFTVAVVLRIRKLLQDVTAIIFERILHENMPPLKRKVNGNK